MTELELEKLVGDHELRIRKLEENDLKQQVQLANIEKSQAEIKVIINDTSREQQRALTNVTEKILDALMQNSINNNKTDNQVKLDTVKTDNNVKKHNSTNDNDTANKVKFYNTKQFWAIASAIATALITYLSKK